MRRGVAEVEGHALANWKVGLGLKVGGKEVALASAGRGREGWLVVPHPGEEEVRAVGSVGCVALSKPHGCPRISQGAEENERVRKTPAVRLSVGGSVPSLFRHRRVC